ncbi:MAG: hypothetical protein WB562_00440 [Candidatus Sulfotelmatobacter sp.]
MYKGPYCLILYLFALASLIAGAYYRVNCTVYLMALLFLAWDGVFILRDDSFIGRDTEKILIHSRDAETLMSYFIGFYAVVFAVIFTEDAKRNAFLQACSQAHISPCLVGAPLVLAAIPMLFIPVEFAVGNITWGVKMLMLVNIYFEKLVVFIFVHDILRISMALPLKP